MPRVPDKSVPPFDICLVHDYLIQMGGAERVVAAMANTYPEAPIFTSVTDPTALSDDFSNRPLHHTFMQCLPGMPKHFKKYFLFYPAAFASIKLPPTRIVWISTSTFSKCILPPADSVSICYCHTPTRFLWDTGIYVETEISNRLVKMAVKALNPILRRADLRGARRMDHFVANSRIVKERIRNIYGRESEVINPPVAVSSLKVFTQHQDYYIIISRLVGYKNIELAVRAFSNWKRELRIVGDGTDRERLQAMAAPNVKFLGRISEAQMRTELAGARAMVFPGTEDFGIAPVEAQACGKPVVAFHAGGALETVLSGITGVFFKERTVEALRAAVLELEQTPWDPWEIRKNAERFSEELFVDRMKSFIASHAFKK